MSCHEYEAKNYNRDYFEQVYPGSRILIWEQLVDSVHLRLVLTAIDDNRHEGELCVSLYADYSRLCMMSFCYLDANIFGLPSYPTMLITRNQTDVAAAREVFDRSFKQSAPQLFCLFAVCGIAMSNGFRNVLAIKHYSQIAYDKDTSSGFATHTRSCGKIRRRGCRRADAPTGRAAETEPTTTGEPHPPPPRPEVVAGIGTRLHKARAQPWTAIVWRRRPSNLSSERSFNECNSRADRRVRTGWRGSGRRRSRSPRCSTHERPPSLLTLL